jgi:hypothetical protein
VAGACRSLPDGHRTGVDGWQVDVEVLVLRLLSADVLGHRWVRGSLPIEASPDERAVELVACRSGLCHSTSWRQDRPGLLVLTYAALPDPCPHVAAAPLLLPLVVTGGGALNPSPAEVDPGHVAAHAVRHLADLAERDPVVREIAQADASLWSAVAHAAGAARHRLDQAS